MTFQSIAHIPTAHGSRYLQQLRKHWSHSLKTEFSADEGVVVFPRDVRGANFADVGRLVMRAQDESLECRLEASANVQLEGVKAVVAQHLDRFAFREAPLTFNWRD